MGLPWKDIESKFDIKIDLPVLHFTQLVGLAFGIDPKEYENKLVYLMSVEKAKFRKPVLPDCDLYLDIEAIRSHGRVWKYKGTAKVNNEKMAEAEWSATIVDRK